MVRSLIDSISDCRTQNPYLVTREVTVTMNAMEITMLFGFVFEGTLGTPPLQYWALRILRSRRLAEDIRARWVQNVDAEGIGIENFGAPKLQISEMASIYHAVEGIPGYRYTRQQPTCA
jgi:hypothetical protein